jgi:hypothetical protein
VIRRARGRCEYCHTPQAIVVEMAIDHIVPEAAGGQTTLENLCLACISCNAYKHDFQTGLDPNTNESMTLFNPRNKQWSDHFAWSPDGIRVVGLTATGRATIERLRMNRQVMQDARRLWVRASWHPLER